MHPRLSLVVLCLVVVAVAPAGVAANPSGGPAVAADPTGQEARTVSASVQDPNASAQIATESFPVTLTDATGTEVRIDDRPERVTTTAPSAAQVLWELGADDQVVGVTQYAHYLDGAERRANVSATDFGVSIERVVDTEPDLVLAPNATSVETVAALRDAGLTVYHFPAATDIEDVKSKTSTIGQLTGNRQAARETNAWVAANVEAVSTATADRDRPQLLYPLLGGYAVGGDTFINEIVTTSGADNVAAGEFDGYQVLSDEVVLDFDPDVLLVTDQTEGEILGSEPYSLLDDPQVATLEVSYLNQPAPRSVVYSTRNLTAQLHPEVYDESAFVSREAAAASLDQPTDTPADSNQTTEANGTDESGDNDAEGDDSTSISAPGFGPVVAVVSLLGGALVARRRAAS